MNMNKMEERTRKTPAAAKPPASTTKIKPATAPPAAKKTVAAHVGKAPLENERRPAKLGVLRTVARILSVGSPSFLQGGFARKYLKFTIYTSSYY